VHDFDYERISRESPEPISQDGRVPAQLDGVAARDLRAARQPAEGGVHRLVHRHDERVDLVPREQFV